MVTCIRAVLAVALLAGAARGRVVPEDGVDTVAEGPEGRDRVSRWATRAHDWLLGEACATDSKGPSSADDLCGDLVRVPRAEIRVYAAGRGTGPHDDAVTATLVGPEGGKAAGPHDAVLVLDPYPAASFGHVVLVFFVALGTTEERCGSVRGLRLGNGDCVQPAREPRCGGGAPVQGPEAGLGTGAPCELLFLPLVTPASRSPHQHHDLLQCRSDIAGFASSPCPQLRPLSEVAHLRCDPAGPAGPAATKRCDDTESLWTRCPFMQTCDSAVILSGGWNRRLSGASSLQKVVDFHGMLKHIGFHEDNIKVFFANGMAADQDGAAPKPAMYPSALKRALRSHLGQLCRTARCADTLLLYLDGPALPGGATLLWDADGDGQLSATEVYSAGELLRDVSHCGASRVVLVADQRYGRDLARHAAQLHAATRGLRNVAVLAAPAAPAAAARIWSGEWTDPRRRHACLADLSSPDAVFLGSPALLNTTLTGMPCGLAQGLSQGPTLSRDQQRLRHRYAGCQNLSTREWMAAQDDTQDDAQDSQEQDDEDEDDDKRSRSENNA